MHSIRSYTVLSAALLLTSAAGVAADQPHARAVLLSVADRKPAPDFALKDPKGKTVKLKDYRGKVLLLDFWATWCTGCKEEIPWFSEFQKTYGSKGFAVTGVSLDDEGWTVLRPFLADHKIPYRMLLGDTPTAQRYGVAEALPDTFLIDQQGRIAAAYKAALVDKDDVEVNIKAILAKH